MPWLDSRTHDPLTSIHTSMNSLKPISTHPAVLAAAIIVLLAAHGAVLYLFRHLALSTTLVSGVALLIVIKHLGVVAPLSAFFRRRFRS
jgi:hypothetical protein